MMFVGEYDLVDIKINKYGTKSLVWSPTHNETQWNKVHLPLLLSKQQARRK